MAIDVLNHMWVGVFSAAYVRQHFDIVREGHTPPIGEEADRIFEEAEAVADEALEAHRRKHGVGAL